MTALPEDSASATKLRELAARYVWWQPVEVALGWPNTLLCSIMRIGTAEDYVAARAIFGEAAFVDALQTAAPGALDERSWLFWHRHLGLSEEPYPTRRFA
ncbi:MAG: hypothetical protein ACREH6_07145 [Geminicoccaceae bacterium]